MILRHFPYKNGCFYNPHYKRKKRSWRECFRSLKADKAHPKPPEGFVYPNAREAVQQDKPLACWLNHSSFHISYNGIHLLTDPIWSKRCSPVSFLGPKRKHPLPNLLQNFQHIHYVLISHNHYDHLDRTTVRQLHALYPKIEWIVPLGVAHWFRQQGIKNVHELYWEQQISFSLQSIALTITAVPSQHFSGRGLRDRNKTLWNGYVVSFNDTCEIKKFYFAGDTGYNPYDFKAIGTRYGPMNLSFIPIGAYHPRLFMQEIHVNPEEAVLIHQEVRSKLSIGMHWKTFKLTSEKLHQPPYDLFLALEKYHIPHTDFRVLEIGQKVHW